MTTAYTLSAASTAPSISVPAAPAVRRRSLLSTLRHRAGLLCVLTMLGSSGAYCVYALGHLVP